MTKEFWVNLPVKDLKRTRDFYTKLGFTLKALPGNREDGICLVPGDGSVQVMLFEEPLFRSFSGAEPEVGDCRNEVLFSVGAGDAQEVDMLAQKVRDAGGRMYAEPAEREGYMYGCGFSDPDGHRWTVLYMDESKMPRQKQELQVP